MKRIAPMWRGFARLGLWLLALAAPATGSAQIVLAAAGVTAGAEPAAPGGTAAADDEFAEEYATAGPSVSDPFEGFNRTMFKVNNTIYARVLRPVSHEYQQVMPGVARRGLKSFFDNLHFPVRFVGCALQGRIGRAMAETGKFVVNTTVGLGGFIKVSDRFPGLQVPEEDLGQAFAKWGVGHGPFLILPVLGPSSVRDLAGRVGDVYVTPTSWDFLDHADSYVRPALQGLDLLSDLPDRISTYDSLHRAALDPYIALRNAYVQFRAGEVAQ